MTRCRFCKSDIPSDARRCPQCTFFLIGEQPQGSKDHAAYIVDSRLIAYVKIAGVVLAIFLMIGFFAMASTLNSSAKIEDTHAKSQTLIIKQAKFDLAMETNDIKNAANIDRKSREDISKTEGDEKPKGSPGQVTYISPGQVTYIVDEGLVSFAKFAAAILAIFFTVGIFLWGFDIKQLSKQMQDMLKQVQDTHVQSQKLDLDIRQAKLELKEATADFKKEFESAEADIKKNVESAEASAKEASETSSQAHKYLNEAEQSKQHIQQYEVTLLALPPGSKEPSSLQVSQSTPDPGQLERLVDVRFLEILRNVLSLEQYSALKTQISAKRGNRPRRQIFDAKNSHDLPGELIRFEGDAPTSDSVANQVYDNLGLIYNFFRDVFGWELLDNNGSTLVVTIHYGQEYGNGFWNGQNVVLGDGDGRRFKIGGFATLAVLPKWISYGVIQFMANLAYQDQSGALLVSFGDIMTCLVEQWHNKQTPDEASWLVGAGVLASGLKGVAMNSLKNPGSAYDDPELGYKDPQPGHMKDYVQTDADNGGVHTNSGIPNKAFFELANKLKGYAWEKPGRIWFAAYQTLKSNSTFQDLANATLDVAREWYGERSDGERSYESEEAVLQSWAAVGINVGPRTEGQGGP